MATRSWLLTVSVLVEEDGGLPEGAPGGRTDAEIQQAITIALADLVVGRPGIAVEWQSMTSVTLDGKPACGRCAVCNRWVYDVENRTESTPTGICRGAVFGGELLCDEHLPADHPVAF
jgi:hypothetical protein